MNDGFISRFAVVVAKTFAVNDDDESNIVLCHVQIVQQPVCRLDCGPVRRELQNLASVSVRCNAFVAFCVY